MLYKNIAYIWKYHFLTCEIDSLTLNYKTFEKKQKIDAIEMLERGHIL